MRRGPAAALVVLAATLALRGGPVAAQDPAPPPAWPTHAPDVPVRYKIDAQLVETGFGDGVRIVGDETVFWKNTSSEPVKVVYLHAYANAFRNTRSTFLREAMRDGLELPDDMKFGDLSLIRVSAHDEELTPKWVAPDDGNADDRTVARVELVQPVEPGDTLPLKVGFVLEMPHVLRRMGARHGFVMAAQWYPKLGMYVGLESKMRNVREGWYCHQYHANCEFAADFADYDVTLRVPPDYTVGATGHPEGEDAAVAGAKEKTLRYRAASVVDFAWTAGKRFVERERDVVPIPPDDFGDPVATEWRGKKVLLAQSDADAALPPVKVVLLVQEEHADQAERMFEAARVALGAFGTWLGPYPYGRLTIVDPPWNASSAGGMEYPMLVTAGTSVGSPPESQRPEGVIVHEICHQWLMGILANNEAEEAWLDEGITSYLTARAMHLAYGAPRMTTGVLGFHLPFTPFYEFPGISAGWPEALDLPAWARPPKIDVLRVWRDLPALSYVPAARYASDEMLPFRRSWMRRAGVDEMVKTGWTYADRTSYSVNAYSRPALFLSTLRRGLADELGAEEGERRFFRALREYAREHRFRHPTTEDFLRKFKEHGADPAPFADQFVRGAATFDCGIEAIRSGDDPELIGLDDKGGLHKGRAKDAAPKDGAAAPKSTIVRVRRRGEAVVPVWLEVRRDDGGSARIRWDGKDRWRDFRFEGKVVSAALDPGGIYLEDTRLCDNTYATESNARPAVKWSVRFAGWLENALLSYGRFF